MEARTRCYPDLSCRKGRGGAGDPAGPPPRPLRTGCGGFVRGRPSARPHPSRSGAMRMRRARSPSCLPSANEPLKVHLPVDVAAVPACASSPGSDRGTAPKRGNRHVGWVASGRWRIRSSSSTSTAPGSTPAASSSPRCGTRRGRSSGGSTRTRSSSRRSAGPGSRRRCASSTRSGSTSSCRSTGRTTSLFTRSSCAAAAWSGCSGGCGRRGGGSASSRPSGAQRWSSPSSTSRSATCSTRSSAASRRSGTSRIRSRACSPPIGWAHGPARRSTSGTPRSTCGPPGRREWDRWPSPGGASTTVHVWSGRIRTRSSTRRRSCLPSSSAARAAELRELLNRALIAYHVDDDPIMDDAAYDVLYDELVAIEAEHPELVTPDSPTQRVGAPLSGQFQKVRHLTPMWSLEKVTTDEAIAKWADDVSRRLGGDEPVAYVLEPKTGGLGLTLTSAGTVFTGGATRGEGVGGGAVTPNLRTIKVIPLGTIGGDVPGTVEVRGEVYMPLSGFRELNERLVGEGKKPTPNPRNAAAGSLRQKDSSITASRPLSFW